MENFLLKEVSRQFKKRIEILRSLFYPRIFLAVFAYFLAISLAFLLGYSREDLANIALYGLMILPYSLNYFFLAYFNAQEKVDKSAMLKIFYPFLHILLGLVFLWLGLNYRWLLFSAVVANAASAAIMLYFYPQIWLRIKFSWLLFKKSVSQTWPFAVLIFLAVLYLRVDVMILKKFSGDQATGWYGPVTNLVQTSLLIPQSFALALFPISSRLLDRDKGKMKRIYRKGLLILFLASLPLVSLGFLLSPILVPLFFGPQYLPSIPALKIAFLSLALFFVNALPGNVILNSKKVKGFIPLALSNLVVNVVLNLVLIPQFSFIGSAWAKVGSEAFGVLINNWYVWRILREKN